VSIDEVHLLQWLGTDSPSARSRLVVLNWEILADAAMRYSDDRQTLDYVLRSAHRYRSEPHAGFALLGENDDVARSFAWVAPYEGFNLPAVDEVLHGSAPGSVMIFDFWAPLEVRDNRLFGRTIGQLAARLSAEGKDVWIFSAADSATITEIESAGFRMRTSLVKRRALFRTRTRQEFRETCEPKQADAASHEIVR
jgi:hypothetical protein